MKDLRIFAMDPGVNNYAFSIVTDKPDVILAGHLENPIQSVKPPDLVTSINLFKNEISSIMQQTELSFKDVIVIERYQSRGHKGIQIELINIMLGIIACMFPKQVILITPSTWKNAIKRKYAANDMHKIIGRKDISPHIADSIGIAAYTFNKYYNRDVLASLLKKEWTWKP